MGITEKEMEGLIQYVASQLEKIGMCVGLIEDHNGGLCHSE